MRGKVTRGQDRDTLNFIGGARVSLDRLKNQKSIVTWCHTSLNMFLENEQVKGKHGILARDPSDPEVGRTN